MRPRPLPPKPGPPCPTCYAAMTVTAGGKASCAKHGQPAPAAPALVERRAVTRVSRRVRPPKYPSDLKRYPLPPSPDGRARYRPTPASPTTARSRLTPELVAEMVEKARAGVVHWQIAGALWERAGYATQTSCDAAVRRALRAAGLAR